VTTSPPTPPDDEQLHQLAEQFLHALLNSADVNRIGVARWWERAKTALETGAAASTSFRQCAARAGKKMEIDVYSEQSADTIAQLATVLNTPETFTRWRTLATRDALTTTAMVRSQRAATRRSKLNQGDAS
jgi:hypothetical protein